MPAQTKEELLGVTRTEWQKLFELLEELPAILRLEKDDVGISPKDIVAHRAHWIELFLGWYRDGQAGKKVFIPAEGYKWNETKRYNADLREKQTGLSWSTARSLLETNHVELLALIEGLSSEALYAAPMKGGNSKWTPGRFAEAAGASHYRSATKYLKQRMKAAETL